MKSIETYTKHAKLIIRVASLQHNTVREVDGNDDQDFTGCRTNLENRNSMTLLQDLFFIGSLSQRLEAYGAVSALREDSCLRTFVFNRCKL
nr:unnamed protein product [Callosobruchus analis]